MSDKKIVYRYHFDFPDDEWKLSSVSILKQSDKQVTFEFRSSTTNWGKVMEAKRFKELFADTSEAAFEIARRAQENEVEKLHRILKRETERLQALKLLGIRSEKNASIQA